MKLKEYKEPWKKTFSGIKTRAKHNNLKNKKRSYRRKPVKYSITAEELKILWFRDKAYLMKEPSIDRKKNSGDYTFKNCQYLEHRVNSSKRDLTSAIRKKWSKRMELQWKNSKFKKIRTKKIRKGLKLKLADPSHRKFLSDKLKKQWKNPDYRKKMVKSTSESSKKMWQKPGFKEKQVKKLKLAWKKRRKNGH